MEYEPSEWAMAGTQRESEMECLSRDEKPDSIVIKIEASKQVHLHGEAAEEVSDEVVQP